MSLSPAWSEMYRAGKSTQIYVFLLRSVDGFHWTLFKMEVTFVRNVFGNAVHMIQINQFVFVIGIRGSRMYFYLERTGNIQCVCMWSLMIRNISVSDTIYPNWHTYSKSSTQHEVPVWGCCWCKRLPEDKSVQ